MEHHDTGLEHEAETVCFIFFVGFFGLLILLWHLFKVSLLRNINALKGYFIFKAQMT